MFSSKITATARAVGAEVQLLRDPTMLGEQKARLLLVDLNLSTALEAATAWRTANPSSRVIGFVSHVDTPTIHKARQAGLEVLPRSRFVEDLPKILGEGL
jgi:hypothetical protein